MRENWNGLCKILECWKTDAQGNIVWRLENLYNTFHLEGEQFLLNAVFAGGITNTFIPLNYYFGLDNRLTLDATDDMDTIENTGSEPNSFGYSRVPVSSSSTFVISQNNDHFRANGPIISFSATGGSWGPVSNLFLTTKSNNTGILIASVPLTQATTLNSGEVVNMRMGLSLKDC